MKSKSDTKKNVCGLLPIFLVFLSLLNVAESAKCSSICGKVKQVPEDEALENIKSQSGNELKQKVPDAQDALPIRSGLNPRIVRGYEPPERGFLVAVIAWSKPEYYVGRSPFKCGGTLLNDRYVLTAGHCVCMKDNDNVPCDKTGKPDYNIKRTLRVYVGLRPTMNANKYVSFDSDISKPYRKRIEKLKIHPGWKGSILEDGPLVDIALIKLYKEDYVEFKDNIGPVCLPPIEPALPIREKFAYAAGWGKTEKDKDNCFTDNRGPVRNTKCRFPFKFVRNKDINEYECQTDKNSFPSKKSPRCIQFRKANPDFNLEELAFIQIRFQTNQNKTTKENCYSEKNVEDYGWCGTCVEGAAEGEEGYCYPDMTGNDAEFERDLEDEDLENEITIVRPATKWGYCSKDCNDIKNNYLLEEIPNVLKETMLTILTDEQCKAFLDGFDDPFSTETELCAGMKFEFPKIKIYDRSFVKKDKNGKNVYKFTLNDTKIDYNVAVKEELMKFGFYLGFSDTCAGDSGGPLYQFHGGKVYQVGIVSRGATKYCAGHNEPGIYSSVINKENLEWIKQNSMSGRC